MSVQDNLLDLRIIGIDQETAVAKTYQLERTDGKAIDFIPGQFLTFIIATEKQEVRRSYSILTLPGEPVKITVKKVANGLVSRYILQHWQMGDVVTSLFPAGRFTLHPQHLVERDIFCFAAGSGIIPILPQIRYLLKHEKQSIIHLIYSNHDEADILFPKEIHQLTKQYMQLRVHYFFSEPFLSSHKRSRISNITAEMLINRLLTFKKEDANFLICGPFAYMRMLIFTLGLMRFKKENIRKESFIAEIMQSGKVQLPSFPNTRVKIKLFGRDHMIEVNSGETILNAALRQGLKPPYSCEGGVCGTCVAKCRSGSVYMSINEVLLDSEINDKLVLTCTGYPTEEGTYLIF